MGWAGLGWADDVFTHFNNEKLLKENIVYLFKWFASNFNNYEVFFLYSFCPIFWPVLDQNILKLI